MAVRDILLLGNPRLYEVCLPAAPNELAGLTGIVEDLHDSLIDFRTRFGRGRAIAAPQIGVAKRLVYMNIDEPVSRNGKQRNRYYYRDFGIDWLVGVGKSAPQQLYYYPLNIYRDFDDINVLKVRSFDFGRCAVRTNHQKGTMVMPVLASDHPTLSDFDQLAVLA